MNDKTRFEAKAKAFFEAYAPQFTDNSFAVSTLAGEFEEIMREQQASNELKHLSKNLIMELTGYGHTRSELRDADAVKKLNDAAGLQAELSIAISLDRIADALEILAKEKS